MGFTNLILEIDFLIVYKFLVNNIIVVNYYDGSYMTHMIQTIVVKYYNGGSHHKWIQRYQRCLSINKVSVNKE